MRWCLCYAIINFRGVILSCLQIRILSRFKAIKMTALNIFLQKEIIIKDGEAEKMTKANRHVIRRG